MGLTMKKLFLYLIITLCCVSNSNSQQVLGNSPWHPYIANWEFNWNTLNDIERIDCPVTFNQVIPKEYKTYLQVFCMDTKNIQLFYGGIIDRAAMFARWPQYHGQPNREEHMDATLVSDYGRWELAYFEQNSIRVWHDIEITKGYYLLSFIKEGTWVRYEINGVLMGKINFKYPVWSLLNARAMMFLEIHSGGKNGNNYVESNEIPPIDIILGRPTIHYVNKNKVKPFGITINDWGLSETTRLDDGIHIKMAWSKKNFKKDGTCIYHKFE